MKDLKNVIGLKTLTGVELFHTAVLVLAVRQSESAVRVHMSLLFGFPSRLGPCRAPRSAPVPSSRLSSPACLTQHQQCAFLNLHRPSLPTPLSPLEVHIFFFFFLEYH